MAQDSTIPTICGDIGVCPPVRSKCKYIEHNAANFALLLFNMEPIKVNLIFVFFSFSGLNQTFIWVSNLRFTSFFNFSFNLNLFLSRLLVGNLELGFSNFIFLGIQNPGFNSQFPTQTDNSFSRFLNLKTEKGSRPLQLTPGSALFDQFCRSTLTLVVLEVVS